MGSTVMPAGPPAAGWHQEGQLPFLQLPFLQGWSFAKPEVLQIALGEEHSLVTSALMQTVTSMSEPKRLLLQLQWRASSHPY